MIRTKSKQDSLSSLIKKADDVFSKFIRYRDMKDGRIPCYICGVSLRFSEAQNMHYIDRDHMATRYDELNCHAGCQNCNCFDDDHEIKYRAVLTWAGIDVSILDNRSRSLHKFMRSDLLELIETYSEKVKQLKKQKSL